MTECCGDGVIRVVHSNVWPLKDQRGLKGKC